MDNEFEVQIRDGNITESGKEVLRKMKKENDLFQYEFHIHKIINSYISLFEGQPLQEGIITEINGILSQVIVKVDEKILEIQNNSLVERRNRTNKLCRDKISSGPVLHNLTTL